MPAQSTGTDISWWDRLIDRLSGGAVPPPPSPRPPGVDQGAWAKNVERARISPDLTVHELGLSVYGETRSLSDLAESNEPIDTAREKIAHMIMNGVALRGARRPSVHPPIEPSPDTLRNPAEKAAYDSSMKAAREAYLSGMDPTQGAIYLFLPVVPDRSDRRFPNGSAPLRTQSGPYRNSFPNRDVPSSRAWINTFGPEGEP